MSGIIQEGHNLNGKVWKLPPLDATLTKEGFPADAKAVGDALKDPSFFRFEGAITADSNLNNILNTGSYSCTSSAAKTVLGSPITESAFHLHVFKAAPENSSETSARPTLQMVTATSPSDERLYWRKHSNGTWSDWREVGNPSHFKPQSQYYGNGSTAKRSIEVGGDGQVLCVYGSVAIAFVNPYGAFCLKNDGTAHFLSVDEAYFTEGVLHIATGNAILNKDGNTYPYILL